LATKKTWTVILSSGAKSPIKQFRLSKLVFYLSLLIIPILIVFIGALTYLLNELTVEKASLAFQLEEKMIEVKTVKEDYQLLQQEAMTVQKTIEEFKLFEEQLSNLNLEMPVNVTASEDDGSGGLSYPEKPREASNTSLKLVEMKDELPELIEKFEETLQRLTEYENELRTIPTLFPAADGRITSHYGNRKDPFNWRRTFHSGTDIAAPLNTAIFAAADGKVIAAGRNGGYGLAIIIDHGSTYETLYAHLNRIDVEIGDIVKKGDIIGGMGTTGRSTGVHLHFEIKKDGERIDPYPYMTFHQRKK
jgi:murein DD-endopeptidase MepM/ murein hydrolase activator NlpD